MSFNAELASSTAFGVMKTGTGLTATNGVVAATLGLLNYGFLTDGTQTNPVASTVNLVTFSGVSPANGVSVVGGNAITVANAGVYSKFFTLNVNKTSGGASTISLWLRYNGVDVAGSCQDLILTGALDTIFVSGNYTLTMAAGSNLQLCWSSADITMQLLAIPARAAPIRPTGDSAKITLTRIS